MLAWDPKLETGIPEIDDQHRLLWRKAGVVLEAVAGGKGESEIGRTLEFLEDYVSEHFATEQRYMAASGYPLAVEHARAHADLTDRLVALERAFHAEGASDALVADLEDLVRGWLTNHILRMDRELAAFLAREGRPGAA